MSKWLTLENGKKKLREILASLISYDNSGSGLTSTNMQDAIDEIANNDDFNLDGGAVDSVYTPDLYIDGGNASGS